MRGSSSPSPWGCRLDSRTGDQAGSLIPTGEITSRERYQLLTSLVVPRPIGWLSTFSADGSANLAPFSYFSAVAATPMLVSVSIGHRKGEPKDSLRHIRESGAFCVNVVTEAQLEVMNASSGEYPADVDEFELTGLPMERASTVNAPFVGNCPAVLECRLFREIDLGGAPNALVLGEVTAVRLGPELELDPDSCLVTTESLRPVARLAGKEYGLIRSIVLHARPEA
jgi:flavin reductase (DIM6/NTAB) family NADH-FMN oxidoreductase RutF